jgi:hypothetical protein
MKRGRMDGCAQKEIGTNSHEALLHHLSKPQVHKIGKRLFSME